LLSIVRVIMRMTSVKTVSRTVVQQGSRTIENDGKA